MWYSGLKRLVRAARKLSWQTDKRVQSLKVQYSVFLIMEQFHYNL
jgi:hypothetical protein